MSNQSMRNSFCNGELWLFPVDPALTAFIVCMYARLHVQLYVDKPSVMADLIQPWHIAIAMTAVHKDRLHFVSNAGRSEIQPLVSRGQITPLTFHNGQTNQS